MIDVVMVVEEIEKIETVVMVTVTGDQVPLRDLLVEEASMTVEVQMDSKVIGGSNFKE